MTETTTKNDTSTVASQILGWDHLEFWVGNARAATAWLSSGFGFDVTAYSGPETGVRDRASYLLEHGDIRLVVTAGLSGDSEVGKHVLEHGDGVRNLAWRVPDPSAALESAARRGAREVQEPRTVERDDGAVTTAAIEAYGQTRHVFVDRSRWSGTWGPGFSSERLPVRPVGRPARLEYIDHVVGNVEEGRLDEWVEWYSNVLGFEQMKHFDAEQISTKYSALRSTVMYNRKGITMPINEPAPGLRKSQITEYLEAYGCPGVQHIAMGTSNLLGAIDSLRDRGVRFLDMPSTYYEDAKVRCGEFDLPWGDLQRLGIEVDKDTGGYLLQIFSENFAERPTLFMEVIQREGATGFGEGNFKALFEAIEREQARRGNL